MKHVFVALVSKCGKMAARDTGTSLQTKREGCLHIWSGLQRHNMSSIDLQLLRSSMKFDGPYDCLTIVQYLHSNFHTLVHLGYGECNTTSTPPTNKVGWQCLWTHSFHWKPIHLAYQHIS